MYKIPYTLHDEIMIFFENINSQPFDLPILKKIHSSKANLKKKFIIQKQK